MTHRPLCRALAFCACVLFAFPVWSAVEDDDAQVEPSQTPSKISAAAGEATGEDTVAVSAGAARAEAKALIDRGRFAEAMNLLGPLVRSREAQPNDVFLFGLAAVGAAQQPGAAEEDREALLDGAIAAFRIMLVDRPGLVRVRLELARAFFLKGEDDLARRHFEQVLSGDQPEAVAANVQGFLNRIRARRRWSMNAGFALAPDSNIGAGSDERIIYIYGLPFRRDAEELTTSGVGLVLWGGAEYQYPLGDTTRLRAGGDLWRREHSGSEFDDTSVSVHLGPRLLLDGSTEASVLGTASQRWTGTVKEHHALGGRIEAARRINRAVTVNGRLSWQERHYRTRTGLDGPTWDISLGGAWTIAPTLRADLSAGYGRDRPERERDRHERYRVGAGVSVALPYGFTVSGGGDYRWTNFEPGWFPHVEDDGARRDRTWSARTSVYNRAFTLMGFSPELGVVHEVRRTNAQLYDYERTSGELRFVRQF